MKLKQTVLGAMMIATLGGGILSAAVSSPAAAELQCTVLPQYICEAADSDKVETSATWLLLIFIIQILTALIGFVAVGILAYAGFKYASAQSDEGQVKEAKDMIRNVMIGLLVYALMWSFAQWLIPGGIFS